MLSKIDHQVCQGKYPLTITVHSYSMLAVKKIRQEGQILMNYFILLVCPVFMSWHDYKENYSSTIYSTLDKQHCLNSF